MVFSAKLTNHVISEGANNFKFRNFSHVFCILMNFLYICCLLTNYAPEFIRNNFEMLKICYSAVKNSGYLPRWQNEYSFRPSVRVPMTTSLDPCGRFALLLAVFCWWVSGLESAEQENLTENSRLPDEEKCIDLNYSCHSFCRGFVFLGYVIILEFIFGIPRFEPWRAGVV